MHLHLSCDLLQRDGCGIFHSRCQASSESFRFLIFRFEKLDFYQTPLSHMGSLSLFEHVETQSNSTPCPSFKDGTVSQCEGKERENRTVLLCSTQSTFCDGPTLHTTAGFTQAAQTKAEHSMAPIKFFPERER